MLKSVHTILHPPELKGRERRRYWLAVTGWFVSTVLGGVGTAIPYIIFLAWSETNAPRIIEFIDQNQILVPIGIILLFIGGCFAGNYIWYRLFILSGYLSDAAAIRILSNRAPTKTSERRHRWLGQVVLLFIYGTFGLIAVWHRQWWVLAIVVPLVIWGVVLIRNAWKEADAMLEGGSIPSDSEERIQYIEKVLEVRRRNNADIDTESLK